MQCTNCGEKMKCVKTCSVKDYTYRSYKCRECNVYFYSEEKICIGAKYELNRIAYAKLKKNVEK